jgi:hypothetical protein
VLRLWRAILGALNSCQQHDLRCLGRDWLRNEDMTRGVTAEAARCLSGLSESGPDNASSALCPMVMLGVATRMGLDVCTRIFLGACIFFRLHSAAAVAHHRR